MPTSTDDAIFERLATWLSAHGAWLAWLGAASVAMLLATPVLLPMWVASLPEDYFMRRDRTPHDLRGWLRRAAAWTAGVVLVLAGVLMLFLPGQGLLTLFAGLSLLPFPGKRALVQRVLQRRRVADGLQWMRRRAGRTPLRLPERDRAG